MFCAISGERGRAVLMDGLAFEKKRTQGAWKWLKVRDAAGCSAKRSPCCWAATWPERQKWAKRVKQAKLTIGPAWGAGVCSARWLAGDWRAGRAVGVAQPPVDSCHAMHCGCLGKRGSIALRARVQAHAAIGLQAIGLEAK